MNSQEEFYVGYLPEAPSRLASFVRRLVFAVLAISVALALILVAAEGPFGTSTFEFGRLRSFEGRVVARPYPVLEVVRPGTAKDRPRLSSYLLVQPGKLGADRLVAGLEGRSVKLEGTLVYRDDQTMIEVRPGTLRTIEPLSDTIAPADLAGSSRDLGHHTLTGEIVDSKCYLGVMNPARLKTHRACAVRCIAGGIPPVFLVRDSRSGVAYYLLVDASGRAVNDRVLDMVAEPLEITGQVRQDGDLLVLMANPSEYVRLGN